MGHPIRKIYFLLPILILSSVIVFAQSVNQKHIAKKKLYYGAAYYPEAWNLENIEQDIQYMKELHMNIVRMQDEYEMGKMNLTLDATDFKNPALVNLLSGEKFSPTKQKTTDGKLVLEGLPFADFPFVIIEK